MGVELPLHPEAANGLVLAVVASSTAPLLLLDGDMRVIAASSSFCGAFHLKPAEVPGRLLSELGSGEWGAPQLASLLKATASGKAAVEAYEMDLKVKDSPPRKLVLNAKKLDFADGGNVHILLSVGDVTDARHAERVRHDLVREREVLLQELQHRVANSLQIIASVLMQSARNVQSEEARTHLFDAHHRVMSVAEMQRQLAITRAKHVDLRAYFTDLCASIGASMIRDHNQISIDVEADDSTTGADVSVSLGLIVTELVINALKHAFPGGRHGKIKVGYHSEGPVWTLSVDDDGVGIPTAPGHAKPGLGTSIVEALTRQLGADLKVTSSSHGTAVSIVHGTAPQTPIKAA